ncbi:MAG: DUF3857 domain-containing protein [Chitinophagaceae bacterium]
MRKLCVLLVLCVMLVQARAGDEYAVFLIDPALKKNSNVVKRVDDRQFVLKNPGEAWFKRKYVLTVFNEKGDEQAEFTQLYNKFIEIRSIEGSLYDAFGKELKRVKNKDIQDLSGVDDNSLMDDSRYKSHSFYYKVYPYTVCYEVELKYNGTMFYPEWFPQSRSLMGVEESRFDFSCPENYEFRYKAFRYDKDPVVTRDKGTKTYTWQVKNLPAFIGEPYSPGIRQLAPLVLFGPTEFEMQGYKGNMRNWQDLGKFIYSLKQGRDELPADVKQAVHQLTDQLSDPSEKVKALYGYLQQNTRYISIQLGIGGWQPFDAKFVAAKKYGDCKALSNYMYALLKEAGIPSNYTVIKAGEGEEDIFSDFPSSQFNHVILSVPLSRDTLWLECTDQFRAPGYMGGFTGNREALVIDENGGRLVRTPAYKMQDNLQVRNIKAVLGDDGTLRAQVTGRYTGMQQDELQWTLHRFTKEKMKEQLHEQFDFATYEVEQFGYKENRGVLPEIDESLTITVSNYATITGRRLFIVPNVMTRSSQKLTADSTRKYEVQLTMEYRDVDTVVIDLPKGYEVEALPKDVMVTSPFGRYYSAVKLADNQLVYYRTMERFSGRYPASQYGELVKFYETIHKADRNRVVLVKNEPLKAF